MSTVNFFEFHALGRDFHVDAYVARSPLPISRTWWRGHPQCGGDGSTTFANSGFAVVLGDGARVALSEQERIAEEFLRMWQAEVSELVATPGVTLVRIGLHLPLPSPSARVLAVPLGPSLVEWGVRTGVEITIHVDLTALEPEAPGAAADPGDPSAP